MIIKKIIFAGVALGIWAGLAWAGPDRPTQFTNKDTIGNTRHNMTQRATDGTGIVSAVSMDVYRNDYQEVCVYCHTPHGGNANVTLPLWNRTLTATTYTTYDLLGTSTLTQAVGQPGANSLACLSCHDGQTAVDSIINMPGSGRYSPNANRDTVQNNGFLDSWTNNRGGSQPDAATHMQMDATGCLACHSNTGLGATIFIAASDFTAFALGTDLQNDHPVGVTYPDPNGSGTDFNTPGGSKGAATFFDTDTDANMGKAEVRVYDGKVECASCHDPHGVPTGAPGTVFRPTFLRVANTGSALCLTCHSK